MSADGVSVAGAADDPPRSLAIDSWVKVEVGIRCRIRILDPLDHSGINPPPIIGLRVDMDEARVHIRPGREGMFKGMERVNRLEERGWLDPAADGPQPLLPLLPLEKGLVFGWLQEDRDRGQ